MWFASSIKTSLISVFHVVKGAQFLTATSVLLFSGTMISPVTKINTSE